MQSTVTSNKALLSPKRVQKMKQTNTSTIYNIAVMPVVHRQALIITNSSIELGLLTKGMKACEEHIYDRRERTVSYHSKTLQQLFFPDHTFFVVSLDPGKFCITQTRKQIWCAHTLMQTYMHTHAYFP